MVVHGLLGTATPHLLLAWMPSGVGVLFAAFAAMAVGAEIERRTAR